MNLWEFHARVISLIGGDKKFRTGAGGLCWEYALEAIMYDVIPNVFIKLLCCPCMNI